MHTRIEGRRRATTLLDCGIFLTVGGVFFVGRAVPAEGPAKSIEYRDVQPTIDTIDPIRVLSANKARELENDIKADYAKLAPSVVRIYKHDDQGKLSDHPNGFSGVIIGRDGLVLTCSHHGSAPQTSVTVELADGKRVPGKMLGRFNISDPKGLGPDLGLVKITEGEEWPAAVLSDGESPPMGQVCLAIGYPGTIDPGRPPVLRVGRILPTYPKWPWLEPTTTNVPGDSGGPLFDVQGRVIGIAATGAWKDIRGYQSVAPLNKHRERLAAGEMVSAPIRGYRASRGEPAQRAAFAPAPDLEDRIQQVSKSVIRIMDGPHPVASGLIIDADGWAVTKASLVGSKEQWNCRLFYVRSKTIVAGRVVATSPGHDLALLKLDLPDWFVAPWSPKQPEVGTVVSTVLGKTASPLQVSVVGAGTAPEPEDSNGRAPLVPIAILPTITDMSQKPVLDTSAWNSAEFDAFRDRFEPGDEITHVNDVPTPTCADLVRACNRLKYRQKPGSEEADYQAPLPGLYHGDWVSMGIRRGSRELTVHIPRIHSVNVGGLEWHAHPLSIRREAFPAVFTHDGCVTPEECGGPVVDLDGNVVGLNIARADATRTLAIPADVLQAVIKDLRQQAAPTAAKSSR